MTSKTKTAESLDEDIRTTRERLEAARSHRDFAEVEMERANEDYLRALDAAILAQSEKRRWEYWNAG